MFTHLKICGITNSKDALAAAELGITFLGFNFFKESTRFISPENAKNIIKALPAMVNTVGILVKPTLEDCLKVVESTGIKFLQIYQPLDFDDFALLPVPVIAAHRVKNGSTFDYKPANEQFVLLDAFDAKAYGGTGRPLNWTRLPSTVPRDRLVLAGGITPQNILEALNLVNPAIIDVASGSEKEPGIKDVEKMRSLQKAVLTFNILKMNNLQHYLLV